jgi:hypothetical protein
MNTPKYKKRAKQSAEDRKNFKKFYWHEQESML